MRKINFILHSSLCIFIYHLQFSRNTYSQNLLIWNSNHHIRKGCFC